MAVHIVDRHGPIVIPPRRVTSSTASTVAGRPPREGSYPRETVIAALARTKVVAHGPKPLARRARLDRSARAESWREVLAALDAAAEEQPLDGEHIAVQEYGVSNTELLEALRARGARARACRCTYGRCRRMWSR